MDDAALKKYTIIASNLLNSEDLAEPANMVRFLRAYGRDIAVVDIQEFVDVFAMELTADELRRAVKQAFSFLATRSLCGRAEYHCTVLFSCGHVERVSKPIFSR